MSKKNINTTEGPEAELHPQILKIHNDTRKSFGDHVHHIVDSLGHFGSKSAEIAATGVKHLADTAGNVSDIAGHAAGGAKNVIVKGYRAFRSHDLDPPNKKAA